MLNYVISIYNFKKVALSLCCSSLLQGFIVLLPHSLPRALFSSIEQDLGDCHLYQMYLIICCALLYYCVVECPLFLSPAVGFICPLGLITNPNILIDTFISAHP